MSITKKDKILDAKIHICMIQNDPYLCHQHGGRYILVDTYPTVMDSKLVDLIDRICENCVSAGLTLGFWSDMEEGKIKQCLSD